MAKIKLSINTVLKWNVKGKLKFFVFRMLQKIALNNHLI